MNPTKTMTKLIVAVLLVLPLAGAPIQPKGDAPDPHFNRLHDYEEMVGLMRDYARAYPDWVTLESIGKSIEGRDIWVVTVNNRKTGDDRSKPAMYIDGNIHANEVQGAETALYTVDFLVKNYGRLEQVTELLDRAAFYVIPMVNPDGRAGWFRGPSTPHYPRTASVKVDDDRDGIADEDGYDDLDGDGIITQMRKKVPMGEGTHRLHPKDPRMLVEIENDELGDYIVLGTEGIDNDGDGRVNEDNLGYVDPNRTWGWWWMPRYVQGGAGDYPLQIPETRAIATWATEHENIGAIQSYHNYGKMILRGPGAKIAPAYPAADVRVYDFIGNEGEVLLPGYDYMVTWKDLYTVYGDTTDHFYGVHGAIAFTNELYDAPADLDKDGEVTDDELMKFNDLLTLGRQFVPWKPYDHPQYGPVEIGGYRHDVGRVPEGWLLEEEIHRNNSFVLFNAKHLPKLTFGEPEVENVGRNLWRVEVPVVNERAIPSMTALASQNKLHRPDIATVTGAKVISSGVVDNRFMNDVTIQKHRPERLMVDGIPGRGAKRLFFLVEGSGTAEVTYDSVKGGTIQKTIPLR